MILSGIVSMYILPVGQFLIAFPLYLAYHWSLSSALSSLSVLIGLFELLLFFVTPGIVIFLPIYESMRVMDHDTFKGLSKGKLFRYIISLGKAIIVASLTFFIFSLIAFTGGEISVESFINLLIYSLGAIVTDIILLLTSLVLVMGRTKH
jgi:hypothetical protein